MKIIPAVPKEADILTQIAIQSKKHWGYPKEWMEEWKDELTITRDFVEDNIVFKVMRGERIIGFYAFKWIGDVSLSLAHFWLLPEYIGQGIGREMMLHALQIASECKAERIELESDPHAEGFYVKMGGRKINEIQSTVCGTPRLLPFMCFDVEEM